MAKLCLTWLMRRTRKLFVLAVLVIIGVYVLSGSMLEPSNDTTLSSVFDGGAESQVVRLTALTGSAAAGNYGRLVSRHRPSWLSLPYDERDGPCFHETWHRFVTNLSSHWPDVVDRNTIGKLTPQASNTVNGLVRKLGEECRRFLEAGQMILPVVYSVISSNPNQNELVTFVTQLGHSRFDRLEILLESWKAAISATIYVPPEEVRDLIRKLCQCKTLMTRSNIDIHLVLKDGNYYPINLLRNVALSVTRTELAYLSDADFLPAKGTEKDIEQIWSEDNSFFDKNVLVVPAFEMLYENVSFPPNKQALIDLMDKGKLIPAREKKWPYGHLPTDYKKYRKTNHLYSVNYSLEYEPYIVMKTSSVPRYKQIFVERYKDKASHLLEVWAKGFRFQVLSTSFAIHYPHNYSAMTTQRTVYRCALAVNGLFLERLRKQYNVTSIPPHR